jgi:hypothetical protein
VGVIDTVSDDATDGWYGRQLEHAPLSRSSTYTGARAKSVHGIDHDHGVVPDHERCARQSLWREDPMM